MNGSIGKGKYAIVDDVQYKKLNKFTWYLNEYGYACRMTNINGKRTSFRMHREIMNAKKNDLVDHINRNTLDNRISNLRFCTKSQNAINTAKTLSKCGYKGVSLDIRSNLTKRYRARVKYNGITYFIGRFATAIEAAMAYNAKVKELFGEFAYLNVIPD